MKKWIGKSVPMVHWEDSMKITFFVLGIVFIIISVFALLIGGVFWYASNHTLDGPAGLYAHQRGIMIKAFLLGVILLIAGVVLLIISKIMR